MSKERSETENLARKVYRENRQRLSLLLQPASGSQFDLAVYRLFGDNPQRDKMVRIGNRHFIYFGLTKGFPTFLPISWRESFDKANDAWRGCENWWAGYPLVTWIGMRTGDDGVSGQLKLNAEVGPLADHDARQSIIQAIRTAALAQRLERIQFEAAATEKGRLYSSFFRKNLIEINNIADVHEIEKKLVQLVADFGPEFESVANVIPQVLGN